MSTQRKQAWTMGAVTGLVVALSTPAALAQVPELLTLQGRLFDIEGEAIQDETLPVRFAIYDTATGGTPLWTEHRSIYFQQGYFSVRLGRESILNREIFDGRSLYLAVKIGTDDEMTPRQQLTSVPYALTAGQVVGDINPTSIAINGSTVIDSTGQWVGDPTGLVGPEGPEGPPGPNCSWHVGSGCLLEAGAGSTCTTTTSCPTGTEVVSGGCEGHTSVAIGLHNRSGSNGWSCYYRRIESIANTNLLAAHVCCR